MRCFDERVMLNGEYESEQASHLAISFERCNPKERSTCKSDIEFNDWIADKYILTLENTWKFRSYQYSSKKLTADSRT